MMLVLDSLSESSCDEIADTLLVVFELSTTSSVGV